MKSRAGSILILTLWVLSFLVISTIGLGRCIWAQLNFAAHLQDRLKMYYLALAGIEKAIVVLQADQTQDVDSLNEKWANSEELFKQTPLGDGYVTVSYQLEQQKKEGQKTTTVYGLMDEGNKININKAPVKLLKNLLEYIAGVEEEEASDIANSIMDWRDADAITSAGGAEDDYYQGLDLPYPCKNSDFQVPEELLLIKGITPQIYAKVFDVIAVYGEGVANINTANLLTLRALGINDELAQQIMEFRRGQDAIEGTEDDNIFKTPAEIINIGPLSAEDAGLIGALISMNAFTVKSDIFRIYSSGILKKGNRTLQRNLVCVVQRSKNGPVKILYWHED